MKERGGRCLLAPLGGAASRWLALGLLLASACTPGWAEVRAGADALPTLTARPGSLLVDANQVLGKVSPSTWGVNCGPWMAVPVDLMPRLQEARITFLRFPGGNWGDRNDLQPYQIDQLISLAEHLDAEPSISVRLLGSTPDQAAALVRYVRSKGYPVRYWSIGNEPSLYQGYTAERFNREWRTFAEAMRAEDPDIRLIGPEIHQYFADPALDPRDAVGHLWLETFLDANGDLVDVVSIHRYPFPLGRAAPPATKDQLRQNRLEWDRLLTRLRETVRQRTGRALPIAVTEVNSHWNKAIGGEATPDSLFNALWWADVLGRMMRHGVDIVAYFALQTPDSVGGWGLLGRFDVRPTFHVYRLYNHFGDRLVYAAAGVELVSVYATLRQDGSLAVLIVNLGPAQEVPLYLEGFSPGGPAEVWRLDASHAGEFLGRASIGRGDLLQLPAESVTLYVIPSK